MLTPKVAPLSEMEYRALRPHAFQPGDRVRHVHDPAVPGTVTAVADQLHPLLAGPMVMVEWDDGYSFRYGADRLLLETPDAR